MLTPMLLGAQTNVGSTSGNSASSSGSSAGTTNVSASTNASTTASINSNENCKIALKPIIAKEEKDFREFIEQTVRNKSDASALIDTATKRYAAMRTKLLGEIDKYQTQPDKDLQLSVQQILTCRKMVDDSLITAESLLKKHVLTNAQAKKTTKLVQKMKELNTKLGEMQREIGFMQGYMTAFSQKLPCYTKQCL